MIITEHVGGPTMIGLSLNQYLCLLGGMVLIGILLSGLFRRRRK